MSDKAVTLFEYLDHLTVKKTDWIDQPWFTKNYSQYMINRFIGMNDIFLPLIDTLNQMSNLPDETHYNFLKNMLPKKKIYFKYISKNKIDKKLQKHINNLMKFFEISETEAIEYIDFIPKESLNDIENFLSDGGVIKGKIK
jgi:hypothetical protein